LPGLIISNIKKRPTRTIVSILAVSLGVVMILLFVGLTEGMLKDSAYRTQNIKADLLFQPPGSSLLLALNNATMPVKIKDKLLEVKGIHYVSPMLHQFSKKSFSLIFGIDPESFREVSGDGIILMEGRLFQSPYECIVDDVYQKSHSIHPGNTLNILNHDFTIVGVFKAGIAARILVPLGTLQELNDSIGKVSIFYIKCDHPAQVDGVYQYLTQTPPFKGYNITKASDIYKVMASNLPGLREFTIVIIVVSILISFLVILLTMYTTITERTREIGILKSLGASKPFIVNLILKESLLLTSIGIGFGLISSFFLILLLHKVYPSLPIEVRPNWIVYVILIALVSGTLGSTYPAYRAARQDPVEALMYE
jgi:putative ABC transport system permease protein